jgi:hypothetical protein
MTEPFRRGGAEGHGGRTEPYDCPRCSARLELVPALNFGVGQPPDSRLFCPACGSLLVIPNRDRMWFVRLRDVASDDEL